MPFIPRDIFNSLPEILQSGCTVFDNRREKDIFLTGALTILSGCLNDVQGVYDQKILYPNLNCFIVAPAASGKGSFSFAKTLGMGYHKKLLNLSLDEKTAYEQALLQYKSELKKRKNSEPPAEEPKKPAFKILYIPGNSSSAAVIQHLVENGGKGIFCETEADTIGNSLKQDWGGYSDLLRKAFHHECVSYSRKTNNEYFEIPTPQLSMAISGTPSQVTGLVNSAEDGLFSRIIFYVFKNKVEWRDVAPKSSKPVLDKHFDLLSNKVLDVVEFLEKYPTEFHLTDNQWAILNREFGIWLKEVAIFVSEEAISVVKRLGVISYRIAMILSALRKYENAVSDKDIYCDDTDFKSALQLVEVYKEHAMYMFSKLPKSGIVNKRMKDFYDALPTSFHRKEGIAIAEQMNIKVRTVDKYLTELVKKELISKEEYGTYCKRC
jgi:transposase